jgi:hypothetical protein
LKALSSSTKTIAFAFFGLASTRAQTALRAWSA